MNVDSDASYPQKLEQMLSGYNTRDKLKSEVQSTQHYSPLLSYHNIYNNKVIGLNKIKERM